MVFRQRFRQWMVVGDEDQRTVPETAVCESIKNPDYAWIDNVLPTLYRAYGNLTRQTETW
jgi:hypothetical protein